MITTKFVPELALRISTVQGSQVDLVIHILSPLMGTQFTFNAIGDIAICMTCLKLTPLNDRVNG